VNIIPDRNWNIKNPDEKRIKVDNLYKFVEFVQSKGLPIVVGTEMNAYGNKFVDDFDAPELKPLVPVFLEGAYIMYAHTLLQTHAGMGYLSEWTKKSFTSLKEKNFFFRHIGEMVGPDKTGILDGISPTMTPKEIEAAKCQRNA
jgi:hypothetical protein